MRTRRPHGGSPRATATLVLLLAVGLGLSQAPRAAAEGPRRVLLMVDQAAGTVADPDTLTLISRSLITALQMDEAVRAAQAVLVDPVAQGIPSSDDQMSAAAVSQGADAWLRVDVNRGADSTKLRLRSFDLARQELVIDREVSVPGGLSPFELAGTDWSGVAHLLAQAYPAAGNVPPSPPSSKPGSARLTIDGRPGSTVSIRGRSDVTIGSDGKAVVELEAPAQYVLRATAPRCTPTSRTLYLAASREVAIDLKPAPSWALAVSMDNLAYPGAGVSWLFAPDSVFLTAGFTTYMSGLAFTTSEVLSSNPLTNLTLRIGAYLAPADSLLRPYVGFGVFARLVDAPAFVGLDPLSPGGLQPFLGVELPGSGLNRFFVEYAPRFFSTQFPELLEASLGTGDLPPGWVFGAKSAVDLLSLQIGFRWKL